MSKGHINFLLFLKNNRKKVVLNKKEKTCIWISSMSFISVIKEGHFTKRNKVQNMAINGTFYFPLTSNVKC